MEASRVGSREKPASLLEGALGGQGGLDIRLTETTEAARRRPLHYSAERGSVLIHAQFFLQVLDDHAALAEALIAQQVVVLRGVGLDAVADQLIQRDATAPHVRVVGRPEGDPFAVTPI